MGRQHRGGQAGSGRSRPGRAYLAARRRSRSGSSARTCTSTESGRGGRAAIAAVTTTNPANPGAALATPQPRGSRQVPVGPGSSAGLGTSLFNRLPYRPPPPRASSFLRVKPRSQPVSPAPRCLLSPRPRLGVPCPSFSVSLVPSPSTTTPPPVPLLSRICLSWCLLEEKKWFSTDHSRSHHLPRGVVSITLLMFTWHQLT